MHSTRTCNNEQVLLARQETSSVNDKHIKYMHMALLPSIVLSVTPPKGHPSKSRSSQTNVADRRNKSQSQHRQGCAAGGTHHVRVSGGENRLGFTGIDAARHCHRHHCHEEERHLSLPFFGFARLVCAVARTICVFGVRLDCTRLISDSSLRPALYVCCVRVCVCYAFACLPIPLGIVSDC